MSFLPPVPSSAWKYLNTRVMTRAASPLHCRAVHSSVSDHLSKLLKPYQGQECGGRKLAHRICQKPSSGHCWQANLPFYLSCSPFLDQTVKKCQPEAPEQIQLLVPSQFLSFRNGKGLAQRFLGINLSPEPEFWTAWVLMRNPTVSVALATTAKTRSVCYFLWMMCFEISKVNMADKWELSCIFKDLWQS